jgi:hypothetical protein
MPNVRSKRTSMRGSLSRRGATYSVVWPDRQAALIDKKRGKLSRNSRRLAAGRRLSPNHRRLSPMADVRH